LQKKDEPYYFGIRHQVQPSFIKVLIEKAPLAFHPYPSDNVVNLYVYFPCEKHKTYFREQTGLSEPAKVEQNSNDMANLKMYQLIKEVGLVFFRIFFEVDAVGVGSYMKERIIIEDIYGDEGKN
jgi:hypothetical protein